MNYYIKVDHSKFNSAATEIDIYISKHKKNMNYADQEVTNLSSAWQGKDSKEFQSQWDQLTDNDSTSKQMIKSLENYAKFLRYASSQYKEAQSKAVNKANNL